MSFAFNELSEPIYQAILDQGFDAPTDIQEQTIPLLLDGETDFFGQAQTGTGKTAAFALPLLEKIDINKPGIQAVVLSPTRELANQIDQEIKKFSKYLGIKTATVYGGVGYRDQIDNLRKANIVIATPGRAIDLLNRKKLKLENCETFIIDEADEMLKMGFIEDVELLLDSISESSRTWMFSATMPKPIVSLIQQKLDNPASVRVKNKTLSNESIEQSYCKLPRKDFIKMLRVILLSEDDFYGIVFCETREETRNVSEKLFNLGKRVVALHGDMSQRERDEAMAKYRDKKVDVLVCTDIASRGLDVSEVTHVINMGLPRKHDSYVHRIGRTGRAGQVGKAISFVSPNEMRNLRLIENLTKSKMKKYEVPKASIIKKNRVQSELEKMDGLKTALKERGHGFVIDKSFALYSDYFQDLSKDELVKMFFSYHFNKELRNIDESVENLKTAMLSSKENDRGKARGGRGSRNDRNGGRSSRSDSRRRPRRRRR